MTERLRKEKEGHEATLNPLVNQFNRTKQNIELRKQDIMQIEGKSQRIISEIEVIRNHINLNSTKVNQANEEISNRKGIIAEIEMEQRELDKKLQLLAQEQIEKEKELNKVRDNLNVMRSAQNETRNRSQILGSLMKAQKDGFLNGIYGRLGDLGTIDAIYDCAITTSCGVLDHIVVDTINNAERCVSYLREHRIGNGKFICLNQVAQQNKQQREKPF